MAFMSSFRNVLRLILCFTRYMLAVIPIVCVWMLINFVAQQKLKKVENTPNLQRKTSPKIANAQSELTKTVSLHFHLIKHGQYCAWFHWLQTAQRGLSTGPWRHFFASAYTRSGATLLSIKPWRIAFIQYFFDVF